MIHTNVVIREKEDETPALDLPPGTEIIEADLATFTILEKGMVGGNTSVGFHFVLPDGRHVLAQTSANIFRGMNDLLTGAEMRFADKLAKKN